MSRRGRRPPPAPITAGPQFIRLTGAPGRIRLEAPDDEDDGGPLIFTLEEYEVPEEGGEVLPFAPIRPLDPES